MQKYTAPTGYFYPEKQKIQVTTRINQYIKHALKKRETLTPHRES
jgi:hypothetical protein